MTIVWVVLGLGGVAGFFLGRWWSEFSRGSHDAERAWRQRRNYRDK